MEPVLVLAIRVRLTLQLNPSTGQKPRLHPLTAPRNRPAKTTRRRRPSVICQAEDGQWQEEVADRRQGRVKPKPVQALRSTSLHAVLRLCDNDTHLLATANNSLAPQALLDESVEVRSPPYVIRHPQMYCIKVWPKLHEEPSCILHVGMALWALSLYCSWFRFCIDPKCILHLFQPTVNACNILWSQISHERIILKLTVDTRSIKQSQYLT